MTPTHEAMSRAHAHLLRADYSRARVMAMTPSRAFEIFARDGTLQRVLPAALSCPRVRRDARGSDESRVLIAEDDQHYAEALRRAFARQLPSAKVTIAPSLSEAARFLSEESYDAVVADVDLGDGLGVEIIERAQECDPSTARALMSGYLQTHLEAAAHRLGATPIDKSRGPGVVVEVTRRLLLDRRPSVSATVPR